jgi:hypothetical protein
MMFSFEVNETAFSDCNVQAIDTPAWRQDGLTVGRET